MEEDKLEKISKIVQEAMEKEDGKPRSRAQLYNALNKVRQIVG